MKGNIGYTDDGMVFMTIMSQLDGKPTQTVVNMDIQQAESLSKELANAAILAFKARINNQEMEDYGNCKRN